MKLNKENGKTILIKEESDSLMSLEDFSMKLYTMELDVNTNELDKIFDNFMNNGQVEIKLNEENQTNSEENYTIENNSSLDDIDKDLEELGEEECIKLDIKIGEFLAKYFDKEWRIQSAKVFRQYASEYMEVAFKRDGKAIKSRWYTGPKINLLSKIADEIKPSQSGMDGRPVVDFVEEIMNESKMQLFIKTSENISVIYTLITRRAFADMKKKAIFG